MPGSTMPSSAGGSRRLGVLAISWRGLDAGLILGPRCARGVVAAVLAQVALLAGGIDGERAISTRLTSTRSLSSFASRSY